MLASNWRPLRAVGRLGLGLFLTATAASAQSQTLCADDSTLTFREDPVLGLVIESIGDAQDYQAIEFAPTDLWELEFKNAAGCVTVKPSTATGGTFSLCAYSSKIVATWDGLSSPLLGGETFDVEVKIKAKSSFDEFHASVKVETDTPSSALFRVRFPRVEAVLSGTPASTRMSAPFAHGVLLPDPARNVTLVGPSKINAFLPPCDAVTLVEPGLLSMQWWSLYDEAESDGALFFFGTKDEHGFRKEWMFDPIAVAPGLDRVRVILRNVPEDNITPDGDFAQPYPFVMRALRGDWYDAAQHYRDWALDQPFTEHGPIGENEDYSAIIRDSKMLGVTQPPISGPDDGDTPCSLDPSWFEFENWPAETISQRQTFDVDSVTPRIFFWDFNSFGRDVGDWFPIQPVFKAAANALVAQGDNYSAYFESLDYSTRVPSYASSYVPDTANGGNYGNIETFGLVGDDLQREFTTRIICPTAPATVQFLSVCQATQFAADYSSYVAETVFTEAGARGLYLDVLTGSDVRLCYDETHGHPVGGGAYYTEGIKDILEQVRETMRHDLGVEDYFMQSEGPSEHFLPYLETVQPQLTWTRTQTFCDLFTGQCPRNGTDFLVTPLYETVYSEFQGVNATLQLNAPRNAIGALGIPILLDPFFMRILRNIFASHVFLGYTPFAGSILSQDVTGENANPALFPDYFLLTDMVRQFMAVLQLDDVREFTVMGQRLRDPILTKAGDPTAPLTSIPFDTQPFFHNWLALGKNQPFVYGAAYARGENEFADDDDDDDDGDDDDDDCWGWGDDDDGWGGWDDDDGWGGWDDDDGWGGWDDDDGWGGWDDDDGWGGSGDDDDGDPWGSWDDDDDWDDWDWDWDWDDDEIEEIGVLLLNWTDPADNLFFGTGDAGPVPVQLSIDPADYNSDAEDYEIYLVEPGGEMLFDSGSISGPIVTTVTVPSRAALFFRIVLDD
ncbi:MAG: DUF6259 domain-containing protein [Planctomycetota bacterium]